MNPQQELSYLTEIRHDLHANPELGFEEERTSELVQRELKRVGIEFKAGLAKGTGILGYLPATENPKGAKTIALRADMDALPIFENTGLSYASKNPGKMHACGHDGHTTILLGTARTLQSTPRRLNNVLLIFQPAEEGGAGGNEMCKEGVLMGKVLGNPADRIFGLHGSNSLEVGQIGTNSGALMASADAFHLTITGRGGHAAMPHNGIDPIMVASHIILGLQTIASRNVSPLDSVVVTIGKVQAGSASNIIPDTAELIGTLRTLNDETREMAMRKIPEIATGIATAFGAKSAIVWEFGYPVTINEPEATKALRNVLKPIMGDGLIDENVLPVMGAEDFSFYGRQVSACFYWLGLNPKGQSSYPNLHAPEFDFNDEAIPIGITAMTALALG